ncbi:MAG: IS1380 family transposase [Verrucomicrobiia bacterium]
MDPRDPTKVIHPLVTLLRQRIYGLSQGYEDLNDHDRLRTDVALQTAVEQDDDLASASTLCRWENGADRHAAWQVHQWWVEQFIASHTTPPAELVLDLDATDDPLHGKQEGAFFHGYDGQYCFLPLYVFCGERLLVAYLRPSNIDVARHAWAIVAFLAKRLRQAWPQVKIVVRGDSGFCRWRLLRWCDRHDIHYIVGLAKNDRLLALAQPLIAQAATQHAQTQQKQRVFGEVAYAAHTWDRARRVIVKAEHTDQGRNPRFVVTNLRGDAQTLYDELYCARGEIKNRIKEQQLGLFADRTSCHGWWANQWRLLLSSLAYTLMEALRRLGLAGTELARAQCGTIRLKLLKIGAVLVRDTRRVRFLLAASYPHQELFATVVARLASG